MRLFIAINIPDNLKQNLVEFQKNFKDFDIKFVEKPNFHFNLKFLGEVSDSDVEKVKSAIADVAGKFEKFKIKIQGLGAFPSYNYIRVIWLGATVGNQELIGLHKMFDDSLKDISEPEKREIKPHLTLGRVRTGRNRDDLVLVLRKFENIEIGEFEATEIKLFRSFLSPKGPEYEIIHTVSL